MGVLDGFTNEDQLLGALALMAAGSARRGGPTGFGEGVLGALQAMQQGRAGREDRDMKKQQFGLQQQQSQMQLDAMKQQAADAAAQRAFRNTIPGPQAQPLPAGEYMGPARDSQAANVPQPTGIDPTAALMHRAMQAGVIGPMDYLNSLRKDNTPFVLKEGETAYGRGANGLPDFKNPLATSHKNDNPADYKLYQLSGAPQAGMSFDEWDLRRRRAGATNVSLGSPVQIDTPTGPALYQPSNRPGQPGQIVTIPGTGQPARPYEKMDSTTKRTLAENNVALQKIDRALALVEQRGQSFGSQNYLGDSLQQRLDPNGVEARAAVADIGSQKLHDRSGAAVSASEAPRLMPFIPTATDTPAAVKTKLQGMRREYVAMQQELNSGGSLQQVTQARGSSQGAQTLPSQDAIAAELARRGR
jgi:hypothetical protein